MRSGQKELSDQHSWLSSAPAGTPEEQGLAEVTEVAFCSQAQWHSDSSVTAPGAVKAHEAPTGHKRHKAQGLDMAIPH